MYKLTVTPEIHRLRDGYGSRNVRVGGKGGVMLTVSNRSPVYVAAIPPEIEADAQIVKTEVDEATMLADGGRLTALPTDPQPVDAPIAETSAPTIEVPPQPEVEMPSPPVEEQDTVVITDPKTDPDKVNKSNIAKGAKKLAARKGRR